MAPFASMTGSHLYSSQSSYIIIVVAIPAIVSSSTGSSSSSSSGSGSSSSNRRNSSSSTKSPQSQMSKTCKAPSADKTGSHLYSSQSSYIIVV